MTAASSRVGVSGHAFALSASFRLWSPHETTQRAVRDLLSAVVETEVSFRHRRWPQADVDELLTEVWAEFGIDQDDPLAVRVAQHLRDRGMGPGERVMFRSKLASLSPLPDDDREPRLTFADIETEFVNLGAIVAAASYTQRHVKLRRTDDLTIDARHMIVSVQRDKRHVPIRRLHYGSPVEIALFVSQAIIASGAGLTALIYLVKRMYNAKLEIRTSHALHEAAYLEAQQKVHALKGAPGYTVMPELPLNTLTALEAATAPDRPSRLHPDEVVLSEEDVAGDPTTTF
jgi:hypothetical protein